MSRESENDDSKAANIVGLVSLPFLLATVVVAPILRGWVLCKLWGWFIVTTFGANPLRITPAIGIMVVAQFVISHPYRTDLQTKDEHWAKKSMTFIFMSLLGPMIWLLVGMIVKSFM